MPSRHRILPSRGVLLVSTDVHGNAEDFGRLEAIFRDLRARERETHWVILGDIVHAPDAPARAAEPELYDYDDGSMEIVDRVLALREEAPDHVHFVLGNHDHGHVGGHHTAKFHDDEVDALESKLSEGERERLRGLFAEALLAVAAPCGVLLTHGSPSDALVDLSALDALPLDVRVMKYRERAVIRTLLGSYGQPDAVSKKMLGQVSSASGLELGVVIHGHDRDLEGYCSTGDHQACPVIFGAPRANKRYVLLDLGARYRSVSDLREGHEIRFLHA